MKISVVITTLSETFFLKKVLLDLSSQTFSKNSYEILLLISSHPASNGFIKEFNDSLPNLRFWFLPMTSRPRALNFLIAQSRSRYIIRLDERSNIDNDYLNKIYDLIIKYNVANIGGVMICSGETYKQKIIANLMNSPFFFGGGKFRNPRFSGQVKSVYLGAFNKALMFSEPWYDELNPRISEDSDLNFRILESGRKIILDSSVCVYYSARDSLKDTFILSFNYGIGRGIFFSKHRKFSELRQAVPVALFFLCLILFILAFLFPISLFILFSIFLLYFSLVFFFSISLVKRELEKFNFYSLLLYFFGFSGAHFSWIFGFIYGLFQFRHKS